MAAWNSVYIVSGAIAAVIAIVVAVFKSWQWYSEWRKRRHPAGGVCAGSPTGAGKPRAGAAGGTATEACPE